MKNSEFSINRNMLTNILFIKPHQLGNSLFIHYLRLLLQEIVNSFYFLSTIFRANIKKHILKFDKLKIRF